MTSVVVAISRFNLTPSAKRSAAVTIEVTRSVPPGAGTVGLPVAVDGAVPGELGLDRATLAALGFDAKVGQTLVVPRRDGPSFVTIGIGVQAEPDTRVRFS
jgi:leucyl aminopeptidase